MLDDGAAATVARCRSGPNPAVRPATDLPSSANAWAAKPAYDWTAVPAANGIAFQTPAFTTDTTIVGPASLDLELEIVGAGHGPAGDRDRGPAGGDQEEYITSGFLRSSNRTLTAASTAL